MTTTPLLGEPPSSPRATAFKCLVWDLDNTLWRGTLLEESSVELPVSHRALVETIDQRGILQSIASKNDPEIALAALRRFGIDEYFLTPQIGWGSKAEAVRRIAERLQLEFRAIAFVDDDPVERNEVAQLCDGVTCLVPSDLQTLASRPEFSPIDTGEARQRRMLYQTEFRRQDEETVFTGSSTEFLATLQMRLTIRPATAEDVDRVNELTVRTHQLNSTGYTYSQDELRAMCGSDTTLLLVAALEDRFGSYGTVGIVVVDQAAAAWTVKLLLVSCRVLTRGIGNALVADVARRAQEAGATLSVEFIPNDRNRFTFITLKMSGFSAIERAGGPWLLTHSLHSLPKAPEHLQITSI